MLNTVDGYTNELANRTGICAISYYGAVLLNAISQRGPASRPYYRLRRTSFPKLSVMTTTESDGLPGAVLMGCQVRLVSVVVSAGAMLAAYVLPVVSRLLAGSGLPTATLVMAGLLVVVARRAAART